jgi:UDP-N-acetyl-2-amino-2-deoxyglucuronate dehydrogenase
LWWHRTSPLAGYEQIHKVEPDKLEIVALCDPVRENAEAFADTVERFQGKRPRLYADHETMLKEEAGNLDAVDIITPHHLHHVVAVACLEAGLHVMVEKPVGVTVKATKAIVEAAKRTGKFAATAEQIRRGRPAADGMVAVQ